MARQNQKSGAHFIQAGLFIRGKRYLPKSYICLSKHLFVIRLEIASSSSKKRPEHDSCKNAHAEQWKFLCWSDSNLLPLSDVCYQHRKSQWLYICSQTQNGMVVSMIVFVGSFARSMARQLMGLICEKIAGRDSLTGQHREMSIPYLHSIHSCGKHCSCPVLVIS